MAGLGHRGFSTLLIRFGAQWGFEPTGNAASAPAIERHFGSFLLDGRWDCSIYINDDYHKPAAELFQGRRITAKRVVLLVR